MMDISHNPPQADYQNTNQNEAPLVCEPSLDPGYMKHGLRLDEGKDIDSNSREVDTLVSSKTIFDKEDYTTAENARVNINNEVLHQSLKIEDPVSIREQPEERVSNARTNTSIVVPELYESEYNAKMSCQTTANPQIDVNKSFNVCRPELTDQHAHHQNISNDSSNVDISVTSEEDVKVTCRYSSTPVNRSIQKSMNDTDCSMSSLGDASPITSIDTESKLHPDYQHRHQHSHCHTPPCPDTESGLHHACKEQDTLHNCSMVYTQPHMYTHRPASDKMRQCDTARQEYPIRSNSYFNLNAGYPGNMNTPENAPRAYSVTPTYEYPQCPDTPRGYNNYKPRQEPQQVSISSQSDLCCYQMPLSGMPDRDYFVYPSIYVSNAGLISVLLRNDMSVEMTVDRTIRVVSHNHTMAVATDSKGTAASLYHPAAKIFQMGYNTDIATETFRAKMTQGEAIFFSNGHSCFKLQESDLKPIPPIKFSDIYRDKSVNLLFSSEGYGESLVATCMQVASQAEYANLPKGGVIVRINGVKVTQSGCGDVTVVTGAKFIRLSPHNGTTRLGNRFVDIEVERDWSVKLTRGTHSFIATKKRTTVSNGKMEAGFDENNSLKVSILQPRHPFVAEPNMANTVRRSGGKRMTKAPSSAVSTCFTPRRRVLPPPATTRSGVHTC